MNFFKKTILKKSIIFFGAILFASFIITSCGTDAKDIKLSDLDGPCDYVEAGITCAKEVLAIRDAHPDKKGWKEAEDILDKYLVIGAAMKTKYTRAEVEECGSFEELQKLSRRLGLFHVK